MAIDGCMSGKMGMVRGDAPCRGRLRVGHGGWLGKMGKCVREKKREEVETNLRSSGISRHNEAAQCACYHAVAQTSSLQKVVVVVMVMVIFWGKHPAGFVSVYGRELLS